jgi:hypothetical protein
MEGKQIPEAAPQGRPRGPTDGPTPSEVAKQVAIDSMPCDCGQCIDAMLAGVRGAYSVDVAALLATRDRYEAALRRIAEYDVDYYDPGAPWIEMQKWAEEALAAAPEDTNGTSA